ncbi:DEAD/DEAH box helicase family protein [Nocardioides daejeonensis]|uniref:restriction endonuclease n=1 Tax=Nocardioides daejeonensis TaxID=1046556 RepID=UPI000D74FA14|nr:DEAD/DEAH box helicase family protein [Nocardioides daejeonensis]
MTVTINELLGDLRATALDERDKGDRFERLIKAYLKTDPEWASKFSDVWLWSEWDGRGNVPDIGIDLVAQHRDRDGFAAIQAKFYDAGSKVAKGDIDSFLAATMRPDFQFTTRYVFDTSAGWTNNVEKEVQGVVQRVDISWLDGASIDWSQYRWETPEVVVPTGKKNLRPHQAAALNDVREGLKTHDRGKLIMACGTGKTFTSLRIAEEQVGAGGRVLFLVPSIQLLSQSLREWMANAEVDIRPFAVCSDVRVGRKAVSDDLADISTIDLTEPATTDPTKLLERMRVGKYAKERMTVVFSTYQSLPVVIEAQQHGLEPFDLIICDEAHRTTGVTLAGQDESAFVKVHDNDLVRASKRLYMTATPRVFGDEVKAKAKDADAVLADMSDEDTYGPELHRLGFGEAVEADLLTDYKVLVLAVDEAYVAENFQNAMAESGEIKLDEAAKLIGCWNGLSKNFGHDQAPSAPMRTAVAFAQNIKASQLASTAFPTMVDRALLDIPEDDTARNRLRIEAQHVDGTMGIHDRNSRLAWLKDATPPNVCRILTNARCLSEGVDVPALDAVLFLTPRGSQVDVVQSVGRVMRKSPGKELGYIILPVVVPSGIAPEDALRDNERYKVVWQVLQALRSHDDRFHALVNKIELNKKRPDDRLDIIPITGPRDGDGLPSDHPADETEAKKWAGQIAFDFPTDAFRDAMYARIVQKVGERRYWESWARDVADIAAAHVARINGLLADETSNPAKEFEVFLAGLRGNLNDNITRDEAIDMLAQHLVTRPIFEALFDGYDFAAHNPVAKTMELMLASLDEHNLDAENETLETFYASVRRRVEGVDNAEGKQRILVELYDKFFAVAFKKTVDKLGIVYTPIEIVDFILRSADAVLRQEFGQGLTDEGVHILDGFTGTGTFLVRLLQSGLIEPHDLARKYADEIHGNEILLLAYYIACVNIETTYAELTGQEEPVPRQGVGRVSLV